MLATAAGGAAPYALAALRVAAVGVAAAVVGVGAVAAAPFAALAYGAYAAYNAMGGLSGMLSSLISGTGSLLSSVMSFVTKGTLALSTMAVAGFMALGKSAIETADKVTLFERRLASIGGDSTSKVDSIRASIMGIADATRSSIEDSGKPFTNLYQVLSKTGASVSDVTALVTGLGAEMKLSGASTVEAERATVQFIQGLAKGKFELQDLKSIAQSAPGLMSTMERAAGMSMAKMVETFKAGGKGAQDAMTKIASGVANGADIAAQRLSAMPRTMGEAWLQVKNVWFNAVAAMQTNSNFMGPVIASIDRIKAVIGGPAFQNMFGNMLAFATQTAEQFLRWLTTGDAIGVTFHRVSTHLQNIGVYARAALKDIQNIANAQLPEWLGGKPATGSNVANEMLKTEARAQSELASMRKSPWTGGTTGDQGSVDTARARDGSGRFPDFAGSEKYDHECRPIDN